MAGILGGDNGGWILPVATAWAWAHSSGGFMTSNTPSEARMSSRSPDREREVRVPWVTHEVACRRLDGSEWQLHQRTMSLTPMQVPHGYLWFGSEAFRPVAEVPEGPRQLQIPLQPRHSPTCTNNNLSSKQAP